MQDLVQPPYRPQPIRRPLKGLSRLLMWIDRTLSRPAIKPFAWSFFISIVVMSGGLFVASPWVEFIVNKSDSLPGTLFVLDKTTQPQCGDTTVFDMPVDARFYRGSRMIKSVKGCTGDVVTVSHHEVFINKRSVGFHMDRSSQGNHPLYAIAAIEIPENKVYLYAPHPKSYDSRYLSYGLRDRSELLGTATRLF